MNRRVRPALMLAAVVVTVVMTGLVSAEEPAQKSPQASALERGRMYTKNFYSGDLAAVHGYFTANMKQEFDYQKLSTMRAYVNDNLGKEESILSEEVDPWGGFLEYRRKVRFTKVAETFEIVFLMREDDKLPIAGFFIRDARAGEQLRKERANQ